MQPLTGLSGLSAIFGSSGFSAGRIAIEDVSSSTITIEFAILPNGAMAPYTLDVYLDGVLHEADVSLPYEFTGLSSSTTYSMFVHVVSADMQASNTNHLSQETYPVGSGPATLVTNGMGSPSVVYLVTGGMGG